MKLISCEACGTVLDLDRIEEPKAIEYLDTEKLSEHCVWESGGYVPAIKCPVCENKISYYTGDC